MNIIELLNSTSVGIFGMVLAAAFCDIRWTKQKYIFIGSSITLILMLQGIVYYFFDVETVRYIYPLITHIPWAIVLYLLTRQMLWSWISVFTAYLCCYIRRWLALFIVAAAFEGSLMQNLVELLLTLPLLWGLIKFAAPSIRAISHYRITTQCLFGAVPIICYGFDYLTSIYTNWFLQGIPVVTEFMAFLCSVGYLIIVVNVLEEERKYSQLEQAQHSLHLQAEQAMREIELLRTSQQKTRIYRHDLRHHLQYILSCLENNRLEQAKTYISEISVELEKNKVRQFCENEAANLILSTFAGKAEEQGIVMTVKTAIPQTIHLSESDLCVLLSNALENALHACQKVKASAKSAVIEVTAYEQNGRIFLQIINSCAEKITFNDGIPTTTRAGHGFGVQSICMLVEKYQGIYNFSSAEGQFILRISL